MSPTNQPSTSDLLTEKQAAAYLNTSVHSIKRWRYEGRLPYVKLSRQIRLLQSDLDAFIADNVTLASE